MPLTLVCDTGIDDALAIAVAAGLGLDVTEVVAVAGNVARDDAAANTAAVVACCGLGAPVTLGPEHALSGEPHRTDHFHGDDGVGGARHLLPPATTSQPMRPLSGPVVATGPLTAVATATAALELTWMGGALWRAGNVTPDAEFNAWWDAEATARVLAAHPVRVVPLDLTGRIAVGPAEVARLAAARSATARWCAAALAFLVERHGHAYLHDPLALLAHVQPERFTWVALTLVAEPDGDRAGSVRVAGEGGPHLVAVDVDRDTVVEAILAAVEACP